MITRPDQYKHQNDSYAIVDTADVRGGIKDVASLTTVNLLAIPIDKRKLRTTVTNGVDSNIYVYSGVDLLDANWGNLSNWINPASSGYTHPTGFTDQPTSPLTGSNIISQIDVTSEGHVNSIVTRSLTPTDIGAASAGHTHAYQPLDADLTAISGLSGNVGILRKTAADTWGLDINNYITSNQTITLSGDVTGAGTTSIVTTVGNDSHGHTSATVAGLAPAGGDINQVLVKNSSSSYDYSWQTPSSDSTYSSTTITLVSGASAWSNLASQLIALPNNLGGGLITIVLTAGSTYTVDAELSNHTTKRGLDYMYNGRVVFESSSTSTRAILDFSGLLHIGSTYGLDLRFNNITLTRSATGSQTYIVSTNGSLTMSECLLDCTNWTSISSTLIQASSKNIKFSNCIFNVSAVSSGAAVCNIQNDYFSTTNVIFLGCSYSSPNRFAYGVIVSGNYGMATVFYKTGTNQFYGTQLAVGDTGTYGTIIMT